MINLLDLQFNEMEELMKKLGQPKFRAVQVFGWLYKEAGKGAADFDDMKNIPAELRHKLAEISVIGLPRILKVQESKLDGKAGSRTMAMIRRGQRWQGISLRAIAGLLLSRKR